MVCSNDASRQDRRMALPHRYPLGLLASILSAGWLVVFGFAAHTAADSTYKISSESCPVCSGCRAPVRFGGIASRPTAARHVRLHGYINLFIHSNFILMSKKTLLIISLQVVAIAAFVGMALACKSGEAVVASPKLERDNRSACGHPDYVFMGNFDSMSACSSACSSAGLGSPCLEGGNCFCK